MNNKIDVCACSKTDLLEDRYSDRYSDNITLEDVYNNLLTLMSMFDEVPYEFWEVKQDIEYELDIEEEHPNECNRLIERAYELFDKYIV